VIHQLWNAECHLSRSHAFWHNTGLLANVYARRRPRVNLIFTPCIYSGVTVLSRSLPLSPSAHTQIHSLGVERKGRDVDHSHPPSADVQELWVYTPVPPYDFVAWRLIN
jgi:hypothetical protein